MPEQQLSAWATRPMSNLRVIDYFAGQALAGLIANSNFASEALEPKGAGGEKVLNADSVAAEAHRIALAMVNLLESKGA